MCYSLQIIEMDYTVDQLKQFLLASLYLLNWLIKNN